MPERIATLTELKRYKDLELTLDEVIAHVENNHGMVKIFDHSPKLMVGQTFRYFVMPLTPEGTPVLTLAKGANL
jgi:hypothetical protein